MINTSTSQTGSRRLAAVRYLGPVESQANWAGLDRRATREGTRSKRTRSERCTANDPVITGWRTALCHNVAVLHVGQSVLSRHERRRRGHVDRRLRHEKRWHVDQRQVPRRFRQGTKRSSTRPRNPISRRRLLVRHLGLRHQYLRQASSVASQSRATDQPRGSYSTSRRVSHIFGDARPTTWNTPSKIGCTSR